MQSSGIRDGEWERWIAVGRALAKSDPVAYEALIRAMRSKVSGIRARFRPLISFTNLPS